MNSEIKTWKISPFYSWEEFKQLPDDMQIKHINSLITRFDVSIKAIGQGIFGLSECGLGWHLKHHGLAQYINATIKGKSGLKGKEKMIAAFTAYKNGSEAVTTIIAETNDDDYQRPLSTDSETDQNQTVKSDIIESNTCAVEENKPVIKRDFHNIALLLQSLAGTGAKLTIEVVL